MRSGCLSYEKFCTEGDLLQRRSQELASRQKVGTESRVATWEWRRGGRPHLAGNAYLVSSGIARPCSPNGMNGTNVVMTRHVRDDDDDVKEQEQLIEEDACAGDDEMQTTVQHQQDESTALLELHIVYHTIYQTPVLYFRVFAIDGTPLRASAITRDVEFPGSTCRSTVIAMEEHPVLNRPFSFLHPCETAAAMQLLQTQVALHAGAETRPAVPVPWYLTSWLSLVQPVTGISPHDYYAL
ncbi:unnamed protein product [Hyaloperonospora brassicae]|uniref:Ubiquitin-like-conjugating enzyme ATG10 n=1 Tax=Hyaloperonospora brassicae TaxID=162125 RepID=A0AAV0UB23_HYABA|nr:unnamed protein product [Hyaloperonospora brassicae]